MGGGGGGRLFEAGRLLTFSVIRMGAYSRWALIRGWALIRINTVKLGLIGLVTIGDSNHHSKLLYFVLYLKLKK